MNGKAFELYSWGPPKLKSEQRKKYLLAVIQLNKEADFGVLKFVLLKFFYLYFGSRKIKQIIRVS